MIVKTYEVEKIKKTNFDFFLLYGENEGLKNEIIKNVLTQDYKNQIIKLEENEIINKHHLLYDEVRNKSLFESKKIIIISRATDKINKVLEALLNEKLEDVRVVIKAGLLDKKSKLRNIFEKNKTLVCIPFYADDNLTLTKLASFFFKEKKISISSENLNLIIERCRGSRENLKNELSKIESFAKIKKNITGKDLASLTNLADNYSHSELCDQCLAKNLKKVIKILNENNYAQEDCIAITRVMIMKIKRLIKLIENSLNNENIDNIISNFKPPIFWKEKGIVKIQISKWDIESIKKFLFDLNDLEIIIKKNNQNSTNLLFDFILNKSKANN